MIEVIILIDLAAVRGGYYDTPSKNTYKIFGAGWKQGTSYASMDESYKGRHPFNIITEEIYD